MKAQESKIYVWGVILVFFIACNNKPKNQVTEKHEIEVNNEGRGLMYADRTDCRSVLQEIDSLGGKTTFHCFRVGFLDSLMIAKAADQQSVEEGKYYQYEMQYDWCILVDGDSVKPVFYQPRQKMETQRNEGVLVFEVPMTQQLDTLIYTDSRGEWGIRKIIIKRS
ncbi:MAG: hypothetical protein IPP99_21165 [Chitinophagaceae bacterium]|nr:hypothetical protein [Chitinophagaceae bacterium]